MAQLALGEMGSSRYSWLTVVLIPGLAVGLLLAWPIIGTDVGGQSFAVTTPHGLWAAVLYHALHVLLALAVSVPQRQPLRVLPDAGPEALDRQQPHSRSKEAAHGHVATA